MTLKLILPAGCHCRLATSGAATDLCIRESHIQREVAPAGGQAASGTRT
jgi:hypothetical protein